MIIYSFFCDAFSNNIIRLRSSVAFHHANINMNGCIRNIISDSSNSVLHHTHKSGNSISKFKTMMVLSNENDLTTVRDVVDLGTPVDLKYIEFNCDDSSQGEENEPVILLHGLLGQKRNFSSLASALSSQLKNKRNIYALDLRNHGDNHHDWRDEMSYSHMCHDVLAFINKLNLSKVILIGHSMGGKVAKSLALSQPDRIAGLVVLDIAPVRYGVNDPAWKAVKSIIDSLLDVNLEPGKTKRNIDMDLRASVEDPAIRAFVLTNLEEDRKEKKMRWKINIKSISSQLDVIAGFDVNQNEMNNDFVDSDEEMPLTPFLYEGDTFFINGGTSKFVKGSYMPVISQYFPNYMLTTIRGSGHWVHAGQFIHPYGHIIAYDSSSLTFVSDFTHLF